MDIFASANTSTDDGELDLEQKLSFETEGVVIYAESSSNGNITKT